MSDLPDQSSLPVTDKADFRIALVLLLVSSALIAVTLTYPMTGDYGGVESQWYVSPAIFPLALLGILLLCSLYMLRASSRSGGHKGLLRVSSWLGHHGSREARDRWAVISCLAVYIYSWIPAMDFYLATSLFLFTVMVRFYLKNAYIEIFAWLVLVVLVGAIAIMRWLSPDSAGFIPTSALSNQRLVLWIDCLAILGLLILCTALVLHREINLPAKRAVLINALLVPLVLIVLFQFFLQVPMPQGNGVVNRALEFFWYEVF